MNPDEVAPARTGHTFPVTAADRRADLLSLVCAALCFFVLVCTGVATIVLIPTYRQALIDLCVSSLDDLFRHRMSLALFLPALILTVLCLRLVFGLVRQAWTTRAFLRRLGDPASPPERLTRAAERLGIARRVVVFPDEMPLGFCHGIFAPRIGMTQGLVQLLDDEELLAVLAHEAHHLARRDPARLSLAKVATDALWFIPFARDWWRHLETTAELAADWAAVDGRSNPLALASSVVKMAQWYRLAGSDASAMPSLGADLTRNDTVAVAGFSPMLARVEALLGALPQLPPISLRMRLGMAIGACVVLATSVAAVGGAHAAHEHEVHEPCDSVLTVGQR